MLRTRSSLWVLTSQLTTALLTQSVRSFRHSRTQLYTVTSALVSTAGWSTASPSSTTEDYFWALSKSPNTKTIKTDFQAGTHTGARFFLSTSIVVYYY